MTTEASRQASLWGAAPASPSSNKRLQGWALFAARLTWSAVLVLTLSLFALAIPARQVQLIDTLSNLSPAQQLVLQDWGVSITEHAGLMLFVEIGVTAGFIAVGVLIYWRKSNDWVAMLVSAGLVIYVGWLTPALDTFASTSPGWRVPSTAIQALSMTLALAFFYVFPDGRFSPRWAIIPLAAWSVCAVLWVAMPGSWLDLSDTFRFSLLSFGWMMAWLSTGVAAQIYRYMVDATPVQRQQTKLILFGTTVAVFGYLVFGFNRFAVPIMAGPMYAGVVYDLIGVPIFLVISLAIPTSFAVSILCYRLWEIDLVINRALVYASLTAILAGLYTASIIFSQRLFVALTGEKSDAAIVLTTLVVASAFTTVKGNLQNVVDRYVKPSPDPIKEIRAFGDRVRSFIEVVDVQQLTGKVLEEAVKAFDATGGAVYLEQGGHYHLVHSRGEWTQVEGLSAWLQIDGERYGWIALGPRRNGENYTEENYALFAEVAGLMARSIRLTRKGLLRGYELPLDGQPSPAAGKRA